MWGILPKDSHVVILSPYAKNCREWSKNSPGYRWHAVRGVNECQGMIYFSYHDTVGTSVKQLRTDTSPESVAGGPFTRAESRKAPNRFESRAAGRWTAVIVHYPLVPRPSTRVGGTRYGMRNRFAGALTGGPIGFPQSKVGRPARTSFRFEQRDGAFVNINQRLVKKTP